MVSQVINVEMTKIWRQIHSFWRGDDSLLGEEM